MLGKIHDSFNMHKKIKEMTDSNSTDNICLFICANRKNTIIISTSQKKI